MQFVHPYNNAVGQSPMMAAGYLKRGVQSLAGAQNIAEQNQPKVSENQSGQKTVYTPENPSRTMQVIGQPGANPNPTSGGVSSTNDYIAGLNKRYNLALDSEMRLNEAGNLLNAVRTGGGAKDYAALARSAQAVGLPKSWVEQIAGGHLGDTQSLQKFISQAVISQAGQNAATAEANNAFIRDNPDIGSDPVALQRYIDFNHKLNQRTFDENLFLAHQKEIGKFNPETHVQDVNQFMREKYATNQPQGGNQPQGQGQQQPGKKVAREYKGASGKTVVVYEDGSRAYK
jgi:hypothetical protein